MVVQITVDPLGGVVICRKLSEETFKLRRTNNFLSQTSEQNATFEDRKVGRQSHMSLRQIAMAATKVQASLLPTPVSPCRQTCPSEVSTAIRTNCPISLGHDQPKRWGLRWGSSLHPCLSCIFSRGCVFGLTSISFSATLRTGPWTQISDMGLGSAGMLLLFDVSVRMMLFVDKMASPSLVLSDCLMH